MKRLASPMFRAIAAYAAIVLVTGCQSPLTATSNMLSAIGPNRKATTSEPAAFDELARESTKLQPSLETGRSMEQQGDLEGAAAVYQQLVPDAACLHRLAVVNDRMGKYQAATQCYERALAEDDANPELLCDYGYSCYLQGRLEQAESCLRRVLDMAPDMKRGHNNLGLVLARLGRRQDALNEFLAAGCTPDQASANWNLAVTGKYSKPSPVHSPTAPPTDHLARLPQPS